jgi:hypothetical protein
MASEMEHRVQFTNRDGRSSAVASLLNLAADSMSEDERGSLPTWRINRNDLREFLDDNQYAIRMGLYLWVLTGIPAPGDYLILLEFDRIDGLRVLPDGKLRFFASTRDVSAVVLTESDEYVKKNIIDRVQHYTASKIIYEAEKIPDTHSTADNDKIVAGLETRVRKLEDAIETIRSHKRVKRLLAEAAALLD